MSLWCIYSWIRNSSVWPDDEDSNNSRNVTVLVFPLSLFPFHCIRRFISCFSHILGYNQSKSQWISQGSVIMETQNTPASCLWAIIFQKAWWLLMGVVITNCHIKLQRITCKILKDTKKIIRMPVEHCRKARCERMRKVTLYDQRTTGKPTTCAATTTVLPFPLRWTLSFPFLSSSFISFPPYSFSFL